ncbi:MAG: heparan-alpha-glucosaminide N-acetyltransferase domain-containing protein, partial [Methylocella sp.]
MQTINFGSGLQLSDGVDGRSNPGRLVFLDGFRGAVVAVMVLVNNPGDPGHVYPQLEHVAWHGMTVADMIAPWFLWVVGVTTAISLVRRMDSTNCLAVLRYITLRAAVLYAIGVALMALPGALSGSGFIVLENLKVMGILQRIAICYI